MTFTNAPAQEKKADSVSVEKSSEGYSLSINANNLPLEKLLEKLTSQFPLRILTYGVDISPPITINFKAVPLEQGLKLLLKESGINNYFMQYRNEGKNRAIVAVLTLLGSSTKTDKKVLTADVIKTGNEKGSITPYLGLLSSDDVFRGKITSLKNRYAWADEETEELAGYLLERMPEPVRNRGMEALMNELDWRISARGKDAVDEEVFFQALESTVPSHLATVMMNSIKQYSQRYKAGRFNEADEQPTNALYQEVMTKTSTNNKKKITVMMTKTIRLIILFYTIYFLGHFSMSTVYRFGTTATLAFGSLSLVAIIFTLWKAAGRAEGTREIVYGIIAGFFIWCFAGEFLEHEGVLEIAGLKAIPALTVYVLATSFILYKKYLPLGVRFALGHFGSVWLLHCILVNQAEVLQSNSPKIFSASTTITGLVFFLMALFMIAKTLKAGSERAFVAYLLSSFLLAWATVETLQVMHVVPDYTYYTYWHRKLSDDSKHTPFSETADKKIKQIVDSYVWNNKEMQKRAYSFLKQLPSPYFLDDFKSRVDTAAKNGNKKNLDEILFYRIMKQSFVTTTASSFNRLLKESVKQFKGKVSENQNLYKHAVVKHGAASLQTKGAEKMSYIKEHYQWESTKALELACHLLSTFSIQFLSHDGLIQKLDNKLIETKNSTVDEALLCQAMSESFTESTEAIFTNLLTMHVRQPLNI
jgi:hypothetical protein